MFSKLFVLVTLSVFAFAARTSQRQEREQEQESNDAGFFAGLKQGVFLPDEASIEAAGCHVPEEPASFEQMKAMLPMVKMMAMNMNNGEEPPFMATIEKALHQIAIIFAVVTGKDHDSEYCRGLILAEEGRTLVMMFSGDVFGGMFGGPGASKKASDHRRLQ